ncbi:hypothetical protein CONLIGDRAFT_368098 [Coniochaeta ligniaria NRRL 30616]|uniref:Secreted protein n=1 Tax=Coniochaeta ligniaria NRRL 30616 TaxID=1408157 RepID=A0A1J7IZ36_9PEZI|nr:hypothetical protein CONLIGDRAFT_368098 [Coniochaeta ligniaria NRRL 30616]
MQAIQLARWRVLLFPLLALTSRCYSSDENLEGCPYHGYTDLYLALQYSLPNHLHAGAPVSRVVEAIAQPCIPAKAECSHSQLAQPLNNLFASDKR